MRKLGLLSLLVALGCDEPASGGTPAPAEPRKSGLAAAARTPPPDPRSECLARIAKLRALPDLERFREEPLARAALLAQVKATPVLFVNEPRSAGDDEVARLWRHELETAKSPGRVLARLLKRFGKHPAFLREVLLSEGYVYARTPELGTTLAEGLTLETLFREPELVVERGATRLVAKRNEAGGYDYAEGPELGKPARLYLFDRLWAKGAEPGPALHVDPSPALRRLGCERFELERLTSEGIVAALGCGTERSPALFERRASSLELVCDGGGGAGLEAARREVRRRTRSVDGLRRAMLAQVDEALPFDEPKTEFGQEDGKLRQEWRLAYRRGMSFYHYNDDRYRVFDRLGRPLVPQVCIDFVIDTFERASGSWWNARGQPPGRTPGRVDWSTLETENRRSVEEFLNLARRKPDWFEVRDVPAEEHVRFERRDRFFETLFERRAEYQPGDVVVIFGLRSDERLHYHTFFVFEADPVTGMPSLVAANAGRPRIRAWGSEMTSAPKRRVFSRVRPRLDWLEKAVSEERVAEREPLFDPGDSG